MVVRHIELNKKQLSKVVIKGYKSIHNCSIDLKAINVLIGCNGSGKSNFISFFRMIRELLEGNLQHFVSKQGGPDALLYFGRKTTPILNIELLFGENGYRCSLEPTKDNRLMFNEEAVFSENERRSSLGSGHLESLADKGIRTDTDSYVLPIMHNWRVYHFHDTGDTALVKQIRGINDNAYLRSDASNLAAYLYMLKHRHFNDYIKIVKTIQLAAPFFGDFYLAPSLENTENIELQWVEKGTDVPFKASHLSDGTLRFICLATVFLQPEEKLPETILVDEPELGLHPYAIEVLAALMKSVATKKQLILGTQSVEFLNQFSPEDVVVLNREKNGSEFSRLDKDSLSEWLEEYSIGELWKKNLLRARPIQ